MNDARILASRYEVGDLIGRGGMAEVHIGYDTRLGRTVAIKILRADLARDPSFQTRFRREAQAAAGLNHPAIVAVYDTGEDTVVGASGNPQAVPFIVMEYVEGHTVRDILKGDVAAPIDEAVEIISGVLSALDYSHHAGLVHRDIKPANVMLTPTGAVKVMDFGIARALADAGQTMTQTQAVVGTAQYLSPEQARGENVDTRSDLYSTGCLLFELLTGRPPFIGDSPVSVAYQHVREAAPKPSQFASDVPETLDKIVLRALAKNRDERYSNAQEFLSDLRAVMAGDPVDPSTGAIAVGPLGPGALGSAALGAGVAGVVAAHGTDADREAISSRSTQAMPTVGNDPATQPTSVMAAQAAPWAAVVTAESRIPGQIPPQGAPPLDTRDAEEEEERKHRRRQYMLLAGAAVAAIAIIYALFLFANSAGKNPSVSPSPVAIPTLEGMTQAEATQTLQDLDLVAVFDSEPSSTIAKDLVTRSAPPVGNTVDSGSSVTVFLSSGPDVATVPSVRGLTQEDAIAAIEKAGLRVSSITTDNDPVIEKGRATKTDPPEGIDLAADTPITLYVASGQVEIPDLIGQTEDAARATLTQLGLSPDISRVEQADAPAGTVFKQDPTSGLVDVGTTVSLQVAVAPTTAQVPNVKGMTQDDAQSKITGAGFTVTVEKLANAAPAGTVYDQSPDPGIQLGIGQPVKIFVSTGPTPTISPTP